MRRFTWELLFTLLIPLLLGLGLGLFYSWTISPLRVIDSQPVALRADFKDQFRSAIAAAYAATGNLPRAEARLALLGDSNSIESLNTQAQQMIANGQPFQQADQLAALAVSLENQTGFVPISPTSTRVENPTIETSTATLPPQTDISFQFTETPQTIETQLIESQPIPGTATRRPTHTPTPTQGAPFALIGQDTICDTNLPDGLLQVIVFNSSRRQLAGIKIVLTWDTGEEQFFTGFKPELGNGYADYLMTPDITYTLQLALGSDIATGLVAPTCQISSGESFLGGIKITFQQP